MTEFLSEDATVLAVAGLSHVRLRAFVSAEVLAPVLSPEGPLFRPADIARLELLCDLADHFELDGDALGVVMSLLDQLHTSRQRLYVLAHALAAEPVEVRHRIGLRVAAPIGVASDDP